MKRAPAFACGPKGRNALFGFNVPASLSNVTVVSSATSTEMLAAFTYIPVTSAWVTPEPAFSNSCRTGESAAKEPPWTLAL